MFTQVELVSSNDEVAVYWLNYNPSNQKPIQVGHGVRLAEVDHFWKINQVLMSLKNIEDLPVKARIGTVVELN